MRQLLMKSLGLFSVLAVTMVGSAYADASEVSALKNEISDLNGKVAALEKMVKGIQGGSRGSSYVPSGGEDGGLIKTAQGINMGGYLDIQYAMDMDKPPIDSSTQPATSLRVFDGNADSFAVNAAELYFENRAEETGDAGFRIDLMFGQDAAVVDGDNDGDRVDLQQAYVEYIAGLPFFEDSEILPDSVHIQVGRFVTLAGMEVIEGPDNWNITRNAAFGFSIPFIHTGLRTNMQLLNDSLDFYLGLNNGWDNAVDNNSYKTLETGFGYTPLENVNMFHTFYWGGEREGTGAGKRWLITNTASVDVTDSLSLAAEINVGNEDEHADTDPVFVKTGDSWHSYTVYGRYQFTDRFAGAARYEIFRDDALFRTGLTDTIFGQTYTLEYNLTDNTIVRGEFRHDKANDDLIFGDDSARTTLNAQVIYLI